MRIKRFICEILLLTVVFSVCAVKKHSKTELVMGTILNIQFFSNKKNASQILDDAFKVADKYDKVFSSKQSYGEVFRLNQCGTTDNQDIYKMLQEADFYHKITGGVFDYTLFPLIKLWNIENALSAPSEEEISATLKNCGVDKVRFTDNQISLENNATVDVGGIAKGKILHLISEYLRSQGVDDFIINGGGDIVLSGLFNGKREWNIAIKDPFSDSSVAGYIQMTGVTIVTSGDYERFFVGTDGKRYHHILDPKTGYPAESDVSSVTVISPDSVCADALSTSLFVMGVNKGLDFINKHKNAEAIFINKNGIVFSAGISEKTINGMRYFVVDKNKMSSNY